MIRPLSATVLIAALVPAAAHAQDAQRGRALAERWCTACHVVSDSMPGGTLGPAFGAMRTLRGRSTAQLTGWIAAPHGPMPDFNLSGREIRDLVAYIDALAAQAEGR